MVVITTIITPILLKFVYKSKNKNDSDSSGVLNVDKFNKSETLEDTLQDLINADSCQKSLS